MFELQILLGNVIAPFAVVLISYLASRALPGNLRSRVTPFVVAVSSGLAIWGALAIRNGFAWWPEDAWKQVPIVALIVTAVAMIAELFTLKWNLSVEETPSVECSATRSSPLALTQCVVIAIAATCAAWLIFPRGESWAELQSQQNQWCIVIALAASLAWWGVAGCRPSVASTVGLATIPLLIASAFLTSLSIMKVTEPLIAVATVLGLCSLFDLRLRCQSMPIVIAPILFAMSGFIAHASFQSYLGLPRTLYFLAMLSPAIIALVARTAQRRSARLAIAVTVVLALILATVIGTWTYVAGEVGSADEW